MNEIVFIISAPSGSGKSTLTAELRRIVPNLEFSISYTTRQPRGSEQNGREYFFVSREAFEGMIVAGQFLEYAQVFGDYYGTARSFLREAFARGNDLILDIDVQGAAQVMRRLPTTVSIFILPPSREELERRLRRRTLAENEMRRELTGTGKSEEELEAIVQRRLQEASREIENYSQYDYILVNEKVEAAIDVLQAIVKSERLKRSPQPPRAMDEQVMATAEMAERANMIGKVQAILATFAVSSSQTTSHMTTE
jgi:guanylate kinase